MNIRLQKDLHPSRLELESWLSGEPGAGSGEVGAHLDACPGCAGRVAGMRALGDRFRFRNPSFDVLSARRRGRSWAHRLWLRLSLPGRPAAAFAALALMGAGAVLWTARLESESYRGVKGAPHFLLFDSRQNLRDPRDTVKVRGGDTLQLAVTSDSPIHYRIFSRAQDGALADLMPLPGEPDSLGAALKGAILPHSLVFPAPVRPERIICVWSRHPLDWKSARALLEEGPASYLSGADSFLVVGTP